MPAGPLPAPDRPAWRDLLWCMALTALATSVRLVWVLCVPTVPVGDFAMYRESANYLSEFGRLDPGFIYMPGFVVLLAAIKDLGGDLLSQKLLGVALGGLATAGVFAIARAVFDRPGRGGCATAVVAALMYALWPAGIALSSVVGTDVPAAALIVVAVGALCALGDRRPWAAALAFGAVMGGAALVRAVALPLTALVVVYWLAARQRRWAAIKLTALSVAATLVVLSPWAVRNLRHDGALSFTDSHGGITALIGANPNSEGTYTRALNTLFRNVTGHSVLDEPHRTVDRAAYRMARDWAGFEPAYALGLATMRAQRLFDDEHLLLYWPIDRPGVLVPPHDAFFVRHRAAIHDAVDTWALSLLALGLFGVALAAVGKRLTALALLPFPLALAATYIAFFAEPRYRVPIQVLAFPFCAFGLVGLGRTAVSAARGDGPARRRLLRAVPLGAAVVAGCFLGAPRLAAAGARLRARHQWAVTPIAVDGQTRLLRWRRTAADLDRAYDPVLPVLAGAPDGVRVRARESGPTDVEAWLDLADLPAGRYRWRCTVRADRPPASGDPGVPLTVRFIAGAAAASPAFGLTLPPATITESIVTGDVTHPGGTFHFRLTVQCPLEPDAANRGRSDIWIVDSTLVRQVNGTDAAP